MKKLISVSNTDINNGTKFSPCNCPIALAVKKEELSNIVVVGLNIVTCLNREFKLPRSAQRFIRRFDKGLPVTPFNFYLKD